MRALTITFAKGIKKGGVQVERYHLHVLKSVQEAKNAIEYVLFNQQKHSKVNFSVVTGHSSVLYIKEGIKIISNFARKKRIRLKVEKIWEEFHLDAPSSYFLSKGLQQLSFV
jgi:hypothetical protein